VIKSFVHKGLRLYYETGSKAGIIPDHAARLRIQLAELNAASTAEDMAAPGYELHQLKGNMAGRWAITVKKNWRLTFDFFDGDAHIVDYEDYH
jgi:proteic killer suppression protein